jgi:hypothetical protein
MRWAYGLLLRLYPYDYRRWFEREMLQCFDANGRSSRELWGALAGCLAEWNAKLTTDPTVRGRVLPDLRLMRPAGIAKVDWYGRCSSDTSR